MAYLKDLKQAILEIPKLVEALKGQKPAMPEKTYKPVPEKTKIPVNTKYSEVKNSDGKMLYYEGNLLRVGTPLLMLSGNEKRTCPDGEYSTDAGRITVKFGKVISVQSIAPASRQANPPVVPSVRREEMVQPRPSAEPNIQRENFDRKFAMQKEQFEREINSLRTTFNNQIASLKATTESQNKTLKEMFTVIDRIANSPSMPSDFKKKDGEPAAKSKNVFEEAKALSQKVFPN